MLIVYASFCMFCMAAVPGQVTSRSENASSNPAARSRPAELDPQHQQLLARVRRQRPARTPVWVNAIPDRIADILINKHLCRNAEYWGLAKASPEQRLPFDEVGTARFIGLVEQYNLYDKVGKRDEASRVKALCYWQSWQDPGTGRFKDPRDSKREVNEKYVAGIIRGLGGEPLYPWTTTGESGKIETRLFLDRTRSDPNWEQGGWGVGSQTGFQAIEIFQGRRNGEGAVR